MASRQRRVSPTTVWCAGVGTLVVVNGIAWRRGNGATLCASLLRPMVAAIPHGPVVLAAGFAALHRHIVRPLTHH